MSHAEQAASESLSPLRLSLAMLLLSFATVLFTLSVWKLLSFFIMPSLFFDLLFVGFPVGAFIGVRAFRVSLGSFARTLWILQGAMLASVAASLACKHFDYLRAHLFEVELVKLVGQMATFTVLFLPFFCAYGLSEYLGYQVGSRRLRGRMPLVYAIYLFGAALAYLLLETGLPRTGISLMIGLSIFLVALSSLLLVRKPLEATLLGAECLGFVLIFTAVPGRAAVESRFLDLYKGAGFQSTKEYARHPEFPHQLEFQRWGRYSLTEIMYSPRLGQFAGFYNDLMQWEYAAKSGFTERMLGAAPINHAPGGGRIAIIGAGGGRQVRWALLPGFQFEEILALELEPAVIEAVRGDLRQKFNSVYEAPNVRVLATEARGYMERSSESFDLIFMPSVGGYPQMMLEPGNMIRTFDAYETLKERLTERGVLAIWYPRGLDTRSILTAEYVRTLGEQGLGMKTQAYQNEGEFLILAAKSPATPLPSNEEIDEFLTRPGHPSGLPPRPDLAAARTLSFFVASDLHFKPITDEQPFLAGNVRHIFSMSQVYSLFVWVAALLAGLGATLILGLRRTGDPRIPGRTYWQIAGVSLLIGANFILFEHYLILALFKKLYVFQDAVTLGAVSFLIVSGLGSVLVSPRIRGPAQVLAATLLIPVLFFQESLSPEVMVALVAPVAFVTGSFFPAVFELCWRNPLAVFAMDAVGAAIGSCVAFFVPIAFGFSAFFPLAAVVFLATSFSTWRFCRGLRPAAAPL